MPASVPKNRAEQFDTDEDQVITRQAVSFGFNAQF